ncbi:hypothetical protein Q5752_000836 [Cryptotrichosporon argae]
MDPSAEQPRAEIVEVDVEIVSAEAPPQVLTPQPVTPSTPASTSAAATATTENADVRLAASATVTLDAAAARESVGISASPPGPLASQLFASIQQRETPRAFQGLQRHGEPEQSHEKQQAANEEEFQRRLRGEYEAAQQRVAELVTGNMSRPLRLTSIRLSPAPPNTRVGFTSSLLTPFLSARPRWLAWLHPTPPPPANLHELLRTTKALAAYVDQFGIFDLERSMIRLETVRGGADDEVELVLGLRERGRLFLKAGTEFGGNEGGGNVTGRIRNVFGGAETLELNAAIGTKTKSAYQASLTTPLLASPNLSLVLQGFSLDRDNSAFASHREASQGARAKVAATTPWGNHEIAYEYVQRDITHLAPSASASIRALAHPSTKAAVSHTWTSDTRDDPWMGTQGRLLKATHEYAGLPGSSDLAHFIKSTTQAQASRPLFSGSNIFVSVASLTSILFPLHKGKTLLPDRTFLGGPNSVRGWKVGGLGLRDGADSLGGDLAWGVGTSLIAPLPYRPDWPLKLHSFLNLGKVVSYDQTRSFADNVTRMYDRPAVSAGIGLLYRFDPLRVEVNFAFPLVARKGERLARGLSVGVGVEFL